MHPLLNLLATRPQLLVDHAQAYVSLISEESGLAFSTWQRRVLLYAAALCFLTVGVALAGVSILLWTTLATPVNAPWTLVAVPVFPLLISVACLLVARQPDGSESFATLRREIKADMAMLRAAGPP